MKEPTVRLIVNADDFGMSDGVNSGIVEAHERGIVTSASLMVGRPAASAAAELARGLPALSVGMHLETAQAAGEGECREQLAAFRRLLGRDPTHVDSHHHVHMKEPVASAARRIAAELGVPLRGERIRYEGGFFGQSARGEPRPERIAVDHLLELVGSLPEGWTELGCHPGIRVGAESSYGPEREHELRTLCDPRVRAAVESSGIELRSFSHVCR